LIISHTWTTGKVTLLEGRLFAQSFYRSLCCFRPSILKDARAEVEDDVNALKEEGLMG
jgi:hypothetical protein